MDELFSILGIEPKETKYYVTAFQHSSYVNENHLKSDYERLEFLGDAVLELVMSDYLYNNLNVKEGDMCPKCGSSDFTPIRKFNLLFETHQGVTEDTKSKVYLRGETAQGIFVNFNNVARSMRAKVPFGVGQIGKSFRNEITPGNFIFRTREFEQMELEFFCKPGSDLEWFGYWKNYCIDFLIFGSL